MSVQSYVRLCGFVKPRARFGKCSKITMTHGIQSKISVCLSVITGICDQEPCAAVDQGIPRNHLRWGLYSFTPFDEIRVWPENKNKIKIPVFFDYQQIKKKTQNSDFQRTAEGRLFLVQCNKYANNSSPGYHGIWHHTIRRGCRWQVSAATCLLGKHHTTIEHKEDHDLE